MMENAQGRPEEDSFNARHHRGMKKSALVDDYLEDGIRHMMCPDLKPSENLLDVQARVIVWRQLPLNLCRAHPCVKQNQAHAA
ncbi:hypothetical protein TNCV_1355031 [Trichonephila clavipes]|uniref:Uncharacterized protein n=1 Tax=Trichonephila clavipes TaxID=2585209 RepID=A0A8X6S604_TRICX|nr:hypothetical protein TNCV_1355031 [Trichonephila clavipes]